MEMLHTSKLRRWPQHLCCKPSDIATHSAVSSGFICAYSLCMPHKAQLVGITQLLVHCSLAQHTAAASLVPEVLALLAAVLQQRLQAGDATTLMLRAASAHIADHLQNLAMHSKLCDHSRTIQCLKHLCSEVYKHLWKHDLSCATRKALCPGRKVCSLSLTTMSQARQPMEADITCWLSTTLLL